MGYTRVLADPQRVSERTHLSGSSYSKPSKINALKLVVGLHLLAALLSSRR